MGCVNEISFVIAPDEFGAGRGEALEPVIDGVSLVDTLKRADGEIGHGGLTEIDRALDRLGASSTTGRVATVQVLGCTCGSDGCSGVTVTISATDDTVAWSDIRASTAPAGPPGPRTYAEVGPFVFAREQYVAALAAPVRAERPIREVADINALAAAIPREHAGVAACDDDGVRTRLLDAI